MNVITNSMKRHPIVLLISDWTKVMGQHPASRPTDKEQQVVSQQGAQPSWEHFPSFVIQSTQCIFLIQLNVMKELQNCFAVFLKQVSQKLNQNFHYWTHEESTLINNVAVWTFALCIVKCYAAKSSSHKLLVEQLKCCFGIYYFCYSNSHRKMNFLSKYNASTAAEGRHENGRHCCPVIFLSASTKLKLYYPCTVSPVLMAEIGNDGHCHCGWINVSEWAHTKKHNSRCAALCRYTFLPME